MPGSISKPGGTGTGASTFSQLGGDPKDNAALAAFVADKAAAAAADAAASQPGVKAGDFSGTLSGSNVAVGSF